MVVCAVGGGGAVAALAADPFEEEDDAVYGAVSVRSVVSWKPKCREMTDLRERIVSASSEMSSSNCTPFTPRFSIKEVKTP